jgi:hypothetical protein
MQDSSHLTIILCSSVIIIVISQKQKVNRKKIHVFQETNNKTLRLHLKIFKLTLDICCYLYCIVFHGTLENFIIS